MPVVLRYDPDASAVRVRLPGPDEWTFPATFSNAASAPPPPPAP